jgi:ubiquinol-cytochrome c reductase iron-sulfur subunit
MGAGYRKPHSYSGDLEQEHGHQSAQALTGYLYPTAMCATFGAATATYAHKYIMVMSAAKDILAMASTEIELGGVPEGSSVTMKWRGKPLFVRHRTQQQIDDMNNTDLGGLRDKETDAERCLNQKYLICLGVCTHLGCVPLADVGNYVGGYFCPCHGSHYDASGRIRQGPAPLNLEVPPITYLEEKLVKVG